VPTAFDPTLFNPNFSAPAPEFNDCILSVGRIERRKCQLELVRALKGTGLRLVLIGNPGPNQIAYFEQIKRERDDTVTIVDHVDQSCLRQYYAACKVHALVSWMETAGMSSLEAAAMGANIVVTDKGDTRDYFGDLAYYCSPDSVASIRAWVCQRRTTNLGFTECFSYLFGGVAVFGDQLREQYLGHAECPGPILHLLWFFESDQLVVHLLLSLVVGYFDLRFPGEEYTPD
jgi:hypothetical protein